MTTVFNDTFEVRAVNVEKKIFDRIDRLEATGVTYGCELTIDINCELWKVKVGEKIDVSLATSLSDEADDGTYRQDNKATLLDLCEYAMHGRVFNFNHKGDLKVEIDVSFGGLLMRVAGDQRYTSSLPLLPHPHIRPAHLFLLSSFWFPGAHRAGCRILQHSG